MGRPRFWMVVMLLRRLELLALLAVVGAVVVVGAGPARAARPAPEAGGGVIQLAATGAERANALAYSPDGRWLAVGTSTGIGLYEAQTLREARYIPTETWVRALAFSPDGERLATGGYDQVVRLWRVADGALLRALAGHSGWVRALAFAPDGLTLVSASDDDRVRVWRVGDGALVQTLTAGTPGVRAVAVSPDGETVATGGSDQVVRLWRAADGALLRELVGHSGWVRCLAFAPDGSRLASSGFDTTVRLWRVADGGLLATLAGHTASVLGLAFSPDGTAVASASVDTTVRLWRVADGAPQAVLRGHRDFVFAVAFAPDGRTLASGAVDNTVRLWEVGSIIPAEPLSADAAPANPADASCVTCHHPRGDFVRPGGRALPPRVVEVACATCHLDGALVLNWCPAFPRSPGPLGVAAVTVTGVAEVGVPHGSRDFSVVLSAPGNGQHVYASAMFSTLPVSGRVYSTKAALTDVEVKLEIWSGSQRTAVAVTRPQADGNFYFDTSPRPHGLQLDVPIEQVTCRACHLDTPTDVPTLPPGDVRLVVTAVEPEGQLVSDERWIVVDRGQSAAATVAVVAEADGQPVAGLPIQANTRLYAWRGRTATGATNAAGIAFLQLEALSAAPTQYTFAVPSTVVDGLLYESVAPVEIILPAGADQVAPLTLTVRAQGGQIAGTLSGSAAPLAIHAIHLPEGTRYDAQASAAGAFAFADLPIGRYRVLADAEALAAQGLTGRAQTVDLTGSPQAEVTLALSALGERRAQGVVADEQGRPLPFAWVRLEPDGTESPTDPVTGAWSLAGQASGARSVVASAPGYYSQAFALAPQLDLQTPLQLELSVRPETRRLAWGNGEIVVPPETQAALEGQHFTLEAGWLWGAGQGGQPVTIATAGVTMAVPGGAFALENVPGQTAWFYLLEGTAEVYRAADPAGRLRLAGGEMLALPATGDLIAVPLDSVVVQALRAEAAAGLAAVWEPSLGAQLRNRLALLGVTTAQVITLVTYVLAIGALVALPLAGLAWRRRARLAHTT